MPTFNEHDSKKLITGQNGSKAITGTGAVTPASGKVFAALQAITAATVSAKTDAAYAVNADLTAVGSIAAGTVVYGRWTSITLSAGSMIGYYAEA